MNLNYNGWERDYFDHQAEYKKMFDDCMSLGEQDVDVSFLDNKIAQIANRRYAVSVANATDGLLFALQAYGVGPGDEVLVPSFGWISSASAVNMAGAEPVFCDIDIDSYQITLDSMKKMAGPRTKAVIYPCLFGAMWPEIFDAVNWCKEQDIIFIEDSAQALGTELNGVKAGSIGDVSVYSFNDNKVIAGINGGGAVMTNSKLTYKHVEKLAYHGRSRTNSDVKYLGRNSKMYLFNAKVIEFRLASMDKWQKRRQEIARRYFDNIIDGNDFLVSGPHKQEHKKLPDGLNHNYHKFTVRFTSNHLRDFVRRHTGANIHYDRPLPSMEYYRKNKKDSTSVAEEVSGTIMTLPCHAWLLDDEVENICDLFDHALWRSYI